MLLALATVAAHWRSHNPTTRPSPRLIAALIGAPAGDVFLMLNGFFIPGLIAFLLAHVAYLVLFRQDAPVFTSRSAWLVLSVIGAVFYAFLWSNGLPEALRLPLAVYSLAIVAMGSVALRRAVFLADAPSRLVAAGAMYFMVSDATLAINRFVVPAPHDPVWVLGTYCAAQCLIVIGLLRNQRRGLSPAPHHMDQGVSLKSEAP